VTGERKVGDVICSASAAKFFFSGTLVPYPYSQYNSSPSGTFIVTIEGEKNNCSNMLRTEIDEDGDKKNT
jgi:hypothetical protein